MSREQEFFELMDKLIEEKPKVRFELMRTELHNWVLFVFYKRKELVSIIEETREEAIIKAIEKIKEL